MADRDIPVRLVEFGGGRSGRKMLRVCWKAAGEDVASVVEVAEGEVGPPRAAAAPPVPAVAAVWLSLPKSSRQRVLIHFLLLLGVLGVQVVHTLRRTDVEYVLVAPVWLPADHLVTHLQVDYPFWDGECRSGYYRLPRPGLYSSFAVHSLSGNRTFGFSKSLRVLFAGVVLEPHEPRLR